MSLSACHPSHEFPPTGILASRPYCEEQPTQRRAGQPWRREADLGARGLPGPRVVWGARGFTLLLAPSVLLSEGRSGEGDTVFSETLGLSNGYCGI